MRNELARRVGYCLGFFLVASSLYGQVSFFQPPSYAGSAGLFSADFNGDGKPDLLSSDGTLQLGNGNGTFTAGTQVPGTPLAVADFNGDGQPDVLETGTGTLLVLLGNGDGTFKAAATTASGAALQPIAATDLNGDGKADVVGIFGSNLLVYLSKGDGTFAAGVTYGLGVVLPRSTSISFADFNGDGKTDVAVSTIGVTAANMEIVFLGNGDGTFQAAKTSAGFPTPCDTASAASGDFTGDGKPDLALNCSNTNPEGVYLLTGNGDGTFQAPTLSIPNVSGTMAAADLNADGKLDLVVEVGGIAGQIFLANGGGTFSNANSYALNFLLPDLDPLPVDGGISIADFNLDGKPDIAVGNNLLISNGNGTFQGVELTDIFSSSSLVAAVGKFDNQQSVPGVAAGLDFGIDILANDGKGGLSLSHAYANILNAQPTQLVTGDFNGDGKLDLLAVTMDGPTGDWGYCVLLGNGDGSLQPPACNLQGVQSVRGAVSVVAGDFNNDKKLDVVVGGLSNQSLAVLLGNGDGTFAPASYVFDGGADKLAAADFNGDGNLDIAAGATTQTIETALLLGKGDGTFQAAVFPSNLTGFGALFTAGLTHDGHADLVSRNQVALGNGDGTFTLEPQLPFFRVGAADFNGDGVPDLLVSPDQIAGVSQVVPPNQTGVLLGNGDGTFSATNDYITKNGALQTPLIADMNNDGRPDIIFSIPYLDTGFFSGIGVLLNTGPANFSLSATALSPSTVTAGNSSSATIGLNPNFGFNQTVTLVCSGLPSGATCAFNPASVPGGTATSLLTISTAGSTAAGTYPIEVQASAGTLTHQVALTLAVQAPDFVITGPSTASQTVGAGQSAMFSLSLSPVGSFSAPVSLACAIAPAATPAPTCSLSSSSVQFSGAAAQTVTVTVGTTAPVTAMAVRTGNRAGFPTASMPLLALAGLLLHRRRKCLSMLSALLIMAAFTPLIGCGSGSGTSSHSQTTPGTPAGTYTITVAATSGSLTHNAALQVIVQ
jgi:MYXO-CTERM domain-containing protein